jgi:hypothetical protein
VKLHPCNCYYLHLIKPNSARIRSLSWQICVLPSTGFELTPLIHCSINRLALNPAPYATRAHLIKNCWDRLLSNYNIKYICTNYTRLYTCLMSIPIFVLRDKLTLRSLKLLCICCCINFCLTDIYIYVWKLNQTVLELDLWADKFVFFPNLMI